MRGNRRSHRHIEGIFFFTEGIYIFVDFFHGDIRLWKGEKKLSEHLSVDQVGVTD